MEIILGINELKKPLRKPVATLGNFDGVHLGHQKIFERIRMKASQIRGESVVITFEPHPLKVLAPQNCPPLLTPFRKKMMLIERSGIDTVLCLEFSPAFSQLTPLAFVKDVLVGAVKVNKIVVGYNYHFGKGKEGDANALREIGRPLGLDVEIMPPFQIGHSNVSSSLIRELIRDGWMEESATFLGRSYFILGRVVEGAKRGRDLGFPTANVDLSDQFVPKPGVYAVDIFWTSQWFHGVANIGWNPTFQGTENSQAAKMSLEVFILSFDRNLYGEEIQVHFRKRIRDEIRFDSVDTLIAQIRKDVQWAKKNVFGKNTAKSPSG